MKRARFGFTLIEISLFLAVSTALFVGIAAATQNSIFQQRYNDSVQNFAEFLRSTFSQVTNVQNESTGRSDQAIYGKVVTFRFKDNTNVIKSYNLIGDVELPAGTTCSNSSSALAMLGCYNANVVTLSETDASGTSHYRPVGFVEDYTMRWQAGLQDTSSWNDTSGSYQPFEGILVIARSPTTGGIYTYIMQKSTDNSAASAKDSKIDETIQAIETCESGDECANGNPFKSQFSSGGASSLQHLFGASIDGAPAFISSEAVDFCINPNGLAQSSLRRNVRIAAGSHTASGIQIITDDPYDSETNPEGNKCS